MLDIEPREPGYIIHCVNAFEWSELWEYILSECDGVATKPRWNEECAYTRIAYRDGKMFIAARDNGRYYAAHEFAEYTHIDFIDLLSAQVDIETVMPSFLNLLEV